MVYRSNTDDDSEENDILIDGLAEDMAQDATALEKSSSSKVRGVLRLTAGEPSCVNCRMAAVECSNSIPGSPVDHFGAGAYSLSPQGIGFLASGMHLGPHENTEHHKL